jgi:hypothetical protein
MPSTMHQKIAELLPKSRKIYRTPKLNLLLTLNTLNINELGVIENRKASINASFSKDVARTGIEPALPCDNQILSLS